MTQKSRFPSFAGLALAATGASHFVKPQLFESMTAPAFPKNTQQYIYVNGAIETAIGLGLLSPKTRRLALAGGLGYVLYLGVNGARNR